MTSAYLAISFLKQTPLPEKQLRIFLSYLPQELLKEYLYNAEIYKGKRNMSKIDLIDAIISEKNKKIAYSQENEDLTKKKKLMNYLKIIILLEKNYKKILFPRLK